MAETADAKDVTFTVKVVVNKQKSKVLYVEADEEFAGVLFSILALPLGTTLRVFKDHYGDNTLLIGSLNTLYNGVANLDSVHFKAGELTKDMLLNPESVYADRFSALKINLNNIQNPAVTNDSKNNISFIISDDLRVKQNMTCSIIDTLTSLGIAITDMEGTQTMLYTFGLSQIMDLLRNAFMSPHPLTDVILGKVEMNTAKMESERKNITFHKFVNKDSSSDSEEAMVKVIFQKSTNKFLFAQADYQFIDYLVSILAIPLGRVEWLLEGNTCLNNIDNLYRTISVNDIDSIRKDWLIFPKLHKYLDIYYQLLPLGDECYDRGQYCQGQFMVGRRMFMVTDDLTVTPLDLTSSISILNGMKVSLSDVQELELHIGEKEALNILKASLTSATALSDALGLKKTVKQEH